MNASHFTDGSAFQVEIVPSACSGTLALPASKSLSHRALICAGLAQGESIISNLSDSQDIQATLGCLHSLGARICQEPDGLHITGTDPTALGHPLELNAHESGSTLRFFIPIAALASQPTVFHGRPSLLSRPMGIYADIFLAQNLPFHQSGEAISFSGPLQGGLFEIPGNISSQFISGLLFALPLCEQGGTIAVIPPYESRSYVDLTLQMMRRFGIGIQTPAPHGYEISGSQRYQPCSLSVEGDYSQLAFFGVLGALQHSVTCTNIERDSLQGDRVILDILEKAGAEVVWNPEGTQVSISHHQLLPQTIDLADCPDLGPVLCVLAAYTPGQTRLIHTARLRYKECDRVAAMEQELRKWNVQISSDEDSMTITGQTSYQMDHTVHIDAHNDHRIVMAMSIFGLCASSPCCIENAQAISKSYPGFFKDLQKLSASLRIVSQK